MASEIDICNLALGHLGDSATVSSINPPEGSVQAEHCARYYAMARDGLLEMHPWNFATKRTTLAELTAPADGSWMYAYARPGNALKILSILMPEDVDYTASESFVSEIGSGSTQVIYSNTPTANVVYIARVTDTTHFSPLFVNTLSWYLASMLAGPILKGDTGAAEAKRCLQMMQFFLGRATVSDANQRVAPVTHTPIWISGR